MNRLLKSSNFWNAVIATGLMIIVCYIPNAIQADIPQYIFFLFAGKTAVSGAKDFIRSRNNVVYDEKSHELKKL